MVYSSGGPRTAFDNQCLVVMSALHGLNPKSLIFILFYVFKVLILEPTKIYQPSYLSINNEVEEKTISIWHVLPDDEVNCAIIKMNIKGRTIPFQQLYVSAKFALVKKKQLDYIIL